MLIEPGGGNFVWKNTGEAIFPHRRFFQLLSLLASIKMMIIAPLILTIIWQQMLLKRNIMPFVDFELWGIGKVRERNARLSLQVKHCKNCKCCSMSLLGKPSRRKKMFSFGHCPNYLSSPPLPPIRATCTTFFGRQKRRFSAYYRTK